MVYLQFLYRQDEKMYLPGVEVTEFRAAWREKGRHWEGRCAGVLQSLAAAP